MNAVQKTKKNMIRCRCKFCPTYTFGCLLKATPQITRVMLEPGGPEKEQNVENMFCAYGKSSCIKVKKDCKCPKCPVFKEYGLQTMYYCVGG